MSNPLVCAVMLTADRQAMTQRAWLSFERQTIAHRMFILDTGERPFEPDHCREVMSRTAHRGMNARGKSIGELRNIANTLAVEWCKPDILAHWDSDDVSAPERLAGQVALLKLGYDAVGYNEMLFWKADQPVPWLTVHCHCGNKYPRSGAPCPQCHEYPTGEAWLYKHARSNYIIGTSLMYWRKTWEAKPFEERNAGEDQQFVKGLNAYAVPGFVQDSPDRPKRPAMIAEVHGSNTHLRIVPEAEYPTSWKRAPEWDQEAERIMKL